MKKFNDVYSKEGVRILEDEDNPSPEFFVKKYRMIQKLLGPSEITYYTVDNKFILLLEDKHITPYNICNPDLPTSKMINVFLKDLFKCSPVCVDYFQETLLFRQLKKNQKNMINDKIINTYKYKTNKYSYGFEHIFDTFYKCLGPNKKNCKKFGKVRFHNIEFRRFLSPFPYNTIDWDGNSILSILIYYLLSSDKKIKFPFTKTKYNKNGDAMIFLNLDIKIIKEYVENVDVLIDIIDNFMDGDMEELSKNILFLVSPFKDNIVNSDKIFSYFTPENLINNSHYMKISKQFDKVDKNIVKNIKTFIKNESILLIENIRFLKKEVNYLKSDDDFINFYSWYWNNIIMEFNCIIFDIYTIARFVKSLYVYDDSSFIVIYAGALHTARYRRFIEKYIKNIKDTDFIINAYSDMYGCIDIVTYNEKWQKLMNNIEKQLKKKNMTCNINE
jgi:hypothetical protein